MQNPSSNNKKHYPALDGLRGMAILFVLLFHFFGFLDYFFFGWLGVDLFFVLSGYLITDILLNTVGSSRYLRNFYLKRTLRIFPLYYLIVFLFIIVLPLLNIYREELQFYIKNQLWFWFYLQNWLLAFDLDFKGGYLNHLWSLAVEEQFYIVWPLIILWLRNPKILLVFMIIFLLMVTTARSIIWLQDIKSMNYTSFYTFTRVDGICIGCIIALLIHIDRTFLRRKMTLIILILAGVNFLFYYLNNPYGILPYLALVGYTTFAILFGFLVYEIVTGNNRFINSFFELLPLRFLGKISYGLYVYHWPLYLLFYPKVELFMQTQLGLSGIIKTILASITITVISFIVAVLSYNYYEKIWLNLKKRI